MKSNNKQSKKYHHMTSRLYLETKKLNFNPTTKEGKDHWKTRSWRDEQQWGKANILLVGGGTIFKHKNIHKVTWNSPDGRNKNPINYVIINNEDETLKLLLQNDRQI